jgi:hypothetical protein
MSATIAENFNEDIAAAIDDFTMALEAANPIHNPYNLNNLIHAVKISITVVR